MYIDSSINLVQQNIIIGGSLAALILMLFLRSGRATLVVSLAIPVSVVGAFVAMAFLGRSLNVISLAGIAFAVGMVVDAAIVVMENIFRLREKGLSRFEAAYQGTTQVWTAVLVSALTTVMVFIPILVMELEVGQLFRDIAVALSASVLLSLLVAITVIPALSNRLLVDTVSRRAVHLRLPLIDDFAGWFVRVILIFIDRVAKSRVLAAGVVAIICGSGVLVTVAFLPKLDYLPDGNRNLIFGVIVPPPGYNLKTIGDIAGDFEAEVKPLLAKVSGPKSEPGGPPKIERFFFIASRGRTFIGAASVEPSRISELVPILKKAAFREPGTFGFVNQSSLFGRGIGGARVVELNISGPDLEAVLDIALRAVGLVDTVMSRAEGTQIRPKPGLELGAPEVRVVPNRVKLADNGVTARELGDTLDAFNDVTVGDTEAEDARWDVLVENVRSSGADTIFLVGGERAGVRNLSYAGIDIDMYVMNSETYTSLSASVTPEMADGGITLTGMTPEEQWETEGTQACAATFREANPDIETSNPTDWVEGEKWYTGITNYCNWVAVLVAVLEAAGPNPTHESFLAGVESMTQFYSPSSPYSSFGPGKYDASDSFRLSVFDGSEGAGEDGVLTPMGPVLDGTP